MRRYLFVIGLLFVTAPLVAAPLVKRLTITVQNGAYWARRCPHRFDFAADITSRHPGQVTVQWIRSDGATSRGQVIRFSRGNQTVRVYDHWQMGRYSGWTQVRVIDGQGNVDMSRRATFTNRCR
ncbi:MAG TPA: hypothetical protein VL284_03705 [Thermoanaerobaculia bacterium]|nr:hypothetical protein [Thermoanaerobaculia bacterium]